MRIIVSDREKAKTLLKNSGFTLGCTMVVAVEVPDSPGGLDSVLQLVSANGINLEYMYAFVQGELDKAVMIFRFDKIEQAIELLTKNGFHIIPGDKLCEM